MTDTVQMPSGGGSYSRDKNGRLRQTEEPTAAAAVEPAEAPPISPENPAATEEA